MASAIRHHHECWDGSGYPDRLRGDDIPLPSRIIALAETFDSMTTGRPNRERMSIGDATNELSKHSGSRFDPRVVKEFSAILESGLCDPERELRASSMGEVAQAAASIGTAPSLGDGR